MRPLTTPPLSGLLLRRVWRELEWNPHPLQRAVLLSNSRNKLLSAGRRVGKSQVGGYRLVPEVFRALAERDYLRRKGLRREYWIVGPEYSDSEKEFRVVYGALERLGFDFDHPGTYNNPLTGEMHISLFDGLFQIHAKSAKYPSTLVGEGLSGVVFSEAAKLKPSVWDKFIRPTLADFGGWAFFGSTPEGRNWFYDLWSIGQDTSRKDWSSWRGPSWRNPYVYPAGVDEELLRHLKETRSAHGESGLEKYLLELEHAGRMVDTDTGRTPAGIDPEIWALFLDMSIEMFGQEVQAEFTEYLGRVFKDFDEEIHVTDKPFDRSWQTYAAVDYGFTNPFAWLLIQVDPHGERIHIVDEYYERNRTTEEAAADIKSRGLAPAELLFFYPDPAEPDRTRTMSRLLLRRAGAVPQTPVNDRIEWIRRKLKVIHPHLPFGHPERFPAMTIHRRCVNTIREMGLYKYADTFEQARERGKHAPENPQKKDDHTPEALGRFMSGRFGSPWNLVGGQARQTSGAVGRGRTRGVRSGTGR